MRQDAEPAADRRPGDDGRLFRSLSYRNFRLFFIGQALSQSGLWMQTVATAVVVLDLTDSGFTLGLVIAAQWLPMLLVGPWGGVLADRYDRRNLVTVAQFGGLVSATAMAVVVLAGEATIPLVFVLAASLGVVNALETPARIALAADLVAKRDVANAVGLNASILTGSRIVGPLLAGVLIAGPGVGWCFAVNAASKVPQCVLLLRMDPRSIRHSPGGGRQKHQIRTGLAQIWQTPALRLALGLLAVASVFTFNHNTVLPLLAEREYDGGPTTYTILFASMSLGSVLGGLVIARKHRVDARFLAISLGAIGLAYIALALAPSTLFGVLLAVPVGFFYLLLGGGTNTVLQANSPAAFRGRVLAMLPIVTNGFSPLGGPLVGLLSDQVGVRAAVALCALPCVLVAAVVLPQVSGAGARVLSSGYVE